MKLWKIMIYATIPLILSILWVLYQYRSISLTGETAKPEAADVIIILGAAVWPSGPSPVLQARTEHGLNIYAQGLGDYFILSGGLGLHPPTEAEAMNQELLERNIEPNSIFLEKRSTSTMENLMYSKQIMSEQGFKTAVIVTDPFHIKRALLIAEDIGITAFGAPTKNSPLYTNEDLRTRYTIREVFAITWFYFYRIFN